MLVAHAPSDLQYRHSPEPGAAHWRALGLSTAAHLLLILAIGVVVFGGPADVSRPQPIAVEMITPAEFVAATAGREAERVPQTPVEPALAPAPTAAAMTTATIFFAGQALRDPANRAVWETLPTLERSDRIIQLCAIEALEQIHRARPDTDPDALAPYAFADVTVVGTALDAPSGAFRSNGQWFGVSLNCSVADDYQSVMAFRFAIGAPIPEREWEAHISPRGAGGEPSA